MWTTAVRLDLTLTHFWMNPVTIKDTRSQIKMLVRLSRCSCCCSVLQMMHNRANDLPSTFSYPQSWKIIPSRLQNAKTAPVTAITRVQLITCTPPPPINCAGACLTSAPGAIHLALVCLCVGPVSHGSSANSANYTVWAKEPKGALDGAAVKASLSWSPLIAVAASELNCACTLSRTSPLYSVSGLIKNVEVSRCSADQVTSSDFSTWCFKRNQARALVLRGSFLFMACRV